MPRLLGYLIQLWNGGSWENSQLGTDYDPNTWLPVPISEEKAIATVNAASIRPESALRIVKVMDDGSHIPTGDGVTNGTRGVKVLGYKVFRYDNRRWEWVPSPHGVSEEIPYLPLDDAIDAMKTASRRYPHCMYRVERMLANGRNEAMPV